MTIWRGSLLFFQQGYGWSESWDWDDQQANNKDPAAAAAQFVQLIGPRMALAGSTTYCNGIRISAANVFRDAALVSFSGTGATGTVGTNGQSAAPATALLCKHNPATFGLPSSYRPYRGIPTSMVTNGGIWTPTAGWTANWDAWKNLLRNLGMGWMGLSQQLRGIVQSVIQTPNASTATITLRAPMNATPPTAPPTLPPVNSKITVAFSGIQGASQANGRHIVTTVDGQVFVTLNRLAVSAYVAGGNALYSAKAFVKDGGTGQTLRIDERKPGRPFYLSRGRRRTPRAA